jgi:hypothetical protein
MCAIALLECPQMTLRHALILPGCALLWILSACSDQSTVTKKEPEKPPEPITGLSAVYKMYQVARTWAPDTQVLSMISQHLEGIPEAVGKAGAWEGNFTSATLGRARTYNFSVVELLPSVHKGVFAGPETGFSGSKGESKPFLIAAVKTDTDAAYQTALAQPKATEYDKKNPGKKITYLLEKIDRFPDVVWRVIWGESVSQSNFSVFVDASTGGYLETMH